MKDFDCWQVADILACAPVSSVLFGTFQNCKHVKIQLLKECKKSNSQKDKFIVWVL